MSPSWDVGAGVAGFGPRPRGDCRPFGLRGSPPCDPLRGSAGWGRGVPRSGLGWLYPSAVPHGMGEVVDVTAQPFLP